MTATFSPNGPDELMEEPSKGTTGPGVEIPKESWVWARDLFENVEVRE